MTEAEQKRREASEELKRFYELLCQKPLGSCIGVHDLVPIFEADDVNSIKNNRNARR